MEGDWGCGSRMERSVFVACASHDSYKPRKHAEQSAVLWAHSYLSKSSLSEAKFVCADKISAIKLDSQPIDFVGLLASIVD